MAYKMNTYKLKVISWSGIFSELQNFTFTNDPPFDVLGIPECGHQVQPMMTLYLPQINATQIRMLKR